MSDIPVFLILAGVALFFRWLKQRAENEQESSARSDAPNESPPPPQSERERVRRFLEALGAPPGAAPPPPVRPRRVSPGQIVTPGPAAARRRLRRTPTQPLPPLTTRPTEEPLPTWRPPPTIAPELIVVESPPISPPPTITIPVSRPAQILPAAIKTRPAVSLGKMLEEAGGLKQAIVLREVLGPPRGLQN